MKSTFIVLAVIAMIISLCINSQALFVLALALLCAVLSTRTNFGDPDKA